MEGDGWHHDLVATVPELRGDRKQVPLSAAASCTSTPMAPERRSAGRCCLAAACRRSGGGFVAGAAVERALSPRSSQPSTGITARRGALITRTRTNDAASQTAAVAGRRRQMIADFDDARGEVIARNLVHGSFPSLGGSAARPLAAFDFTVPGLIAITDAISASDRPSQ
jgi:hypothetical protein